MTFTSTWQELIEECEEVSENATFVTPTTDRQFRISHVEDDRIVVDLDGLDDPRPLPRDQFEALYDRISDSVNGFSLDNLPTGTEPYAAVLSLHPEYEIDEAEGVITETEGSEANQLTDEARETGGEERSEPDLDVHSDALLLIDALERHDPDALGDEDTSTLVNLYTLLSDVQREADDLRKEIGDAMLERIHHDQPVHSQFGSVQRTTRRRRSLREEEEVLTALEDAGVPREQVMGVDREKVDEALDVVELPENAVYDVEEREYVRKSDVDEERKQSRLQGLKDQLAMSEDPETEELRNEIEELEGRIEELTEFQSGNAFHTQSRSDS